MNRWILLLRGVSQTGKNRVPMPAFREALTRAGFQNTRTWIQSGNALVETPKGREETRLLAEKALKEDVGADILVIVKTAEDIRRALAGNPFPGLDSARVFYGFYNEAPSPQKAAPLLETDFGEDRLALGADAVYTYIPGSAARTRLTTDFLQRKLGTPLAFRSRNTLGKLLEMAGE